MAPKAKSPTRPGVITTVRGNPNPSTLTRQPYRSPRVVVGVRGGGLLTGDVEDESARQHEGQRAADGRRRVGVVLRLCVYMWTMRSVGTSVLVLATD